MKHKINPQIDCVFKTLLGSEDNKFLLLDFLNSILQPAQTIESVTILNPFNEKSFMSDKLTIVDIKAEDVLKRQYQIEIQIGIHASLAERMLYTWADIYTTQLQNGDNYNELAPVISIWLLAKDLFKESTDYYHHYKLQDQANQACKHFLTEHLSIHVLELNKWQKPESLSPSDHWVYFFKEAHDWLSLPPELNTPVMEKAMATLQGYSEKELEYDRYRRRELYLHEEATWRVMHEKEEELRKAAQQQSSMFEKKSNQFEKKSNQFEKKSNQLGKKNEQLGKEKDQLGKENERLLALLKNADIDPN